MSDYAILGKRVPRVDALDKAMGRALYSADISLPNMLYGKILRSPYAHAIIRRLDISRAQALKGVKAVVTAADIPKNNAFDPSIVPYLAKEKVLFAGHAVAVVAAVNLDIAEDALGLIEVDYEELPPVLDALEAMKPDATLIHPDMFTNLMVPGLPGKATVPSNIAWQV
jgi:CO/xanthine dehydrogenase Mo-binding subunit